MLLAVERLALLLQLGTVKRLERKRGAGELIDELILFFFLFFTKFSLKVFLRRDFSTSASPSSASGRAAPAPSPYWTAAAPCPDCETQNAHSPEVEEHTEKKKKRRIKSATSLEVFAKLTGSFFIFYLVGPETMFK